MNVTVLHVKIVPLAMTLQTATNAFASLDTKERTVEQVRNVAFILPSL